jgi:hypothetical protein
VLESRTCVLIYEAHVLIGWAPAPAPSRVFVLARKMRFLRKLAPLLSSHTSHVINVQGCYERGNEALNSVKLSQHCLAIAERRPGHVTVRVALLPQGRGEVPVSSPFSP